MFGKFNQASRTIPQKQQPTSILGKRGVLPSVIAADMCVLGNVISDGMLDIDGKIEGNVRCHTASIRENGLVKGDVVAEVVHVYGTIEGLVKAKSVMLYGSARVAGTVMHESLTIEDGAFIDGKLKRTDKVFMEDESAAMLTSQASQMLEAHFDNDNDDASDAERIVLEHLRLIR